ncbi:glycosyltransferase [Candidatus Enterococcus ferrettii]|uniref:Glycosyltransferase family 8 protein n=1 Tax=Candidatus Enterococcus ferrettii TaxID=2815324 RepID=A0ABV0ET83_9ENTE|nr:glycosyltransferase [Enterococcus sp. 665A]MBO1342787.1 hypothetical protein [Enterococcus sp. 665A]
MTSKAVVYTINQNNIELVGTSLFSLIKHYDSEEFLSILLLVDDIVEKDITILRAFSQAMKKEQIEISVWQMPQELNQITSFKVDVGPMRYHLTKFFLPRYFSGFEEIIYLDAETLVVGNIAEYFCAFTDEYAVGLVKKIRGTKNSQTNSESFNSDSIIFNTQEYNQRYSVDDLITTINTCSTEITMNELTYQIFKENSQFLPANFNVTDANETFEAERYEQECIVKNFKCSAEKNKPWNHLALLNNWDREFWINFTGMKSLVFKVHNNAESF